MSEEQPDYITEALELLKGEPAAIIEQPRARLVLREGLDEEWTGAWVKLSTTFKPHIKEIRGAPLAVWLYISLSINRQGVAFPSINKIAEETGYSRNGVMDAVTELEEKGYLRVRRGERKFNLYEPKFAANGRGNEPKGDESTKFTGLLFAPDESTFLPDESSAVDLNKRNKREQDSVDTLLKFEELKHANNGKGWEGREIFLPDTLPLVDWFHERTGLDCPKKKRKDWMRAVTDWAANRLTVPDLQAAYDMDIKWRGVFTSPNQLTDKAVALKAQKQARPEQEYLRML